MRIKERLNKVADNFFATYPGIAIAFGHRPELEAAEPATEKFAKPKAPDWTRVQFADQLFLESVINQLVAEDRTPLPLPTIRQTLRGRVIFVVPPPTPAGTVIRTMNFLSVTRINFIYTNGSQELGQVFIVSDSEAERVKVLTEGAEAKINDGLE